MSCMHIFFINIQYDSRTVQLGWLLQGFYGHDTINLLHGLQYVNCNNNNNLINFSVKYYSIIPYIRNYAVHVLTTNALEWSGKYMTRGMSHLITAFYSALMKKVNMQTHKRFVFTNGNVLFNCMAIMFIIVNIKRNFLRLHKVMYTLKSIFWFSHPFLSRINCICPFRF